MRVSKHARARVLRWWIVALGFVLVSAANAVTQDITAQFAIARSGLVLNRTTNTFDSNVTLRNLSTAPVLAPISAVVGALPAGVTLANKAGLLPDGRPYVSPLPPGSMLAGGATLSFVLKFSNPQRVPFTSSLQVLYSFEVPPDAPTLISVVATGGAGAGIIGRVDAWPNRAITVQAQVASTCVFGTLIGGANAGGPVATTTDVNGYFSAAITGVNAGAFVAIKLTAPGTSPLSLCQASARDNDSWPKAFALGGDAPTTTDLIDAPGKARWYKIAVLPGQRIQVALTGLPADYDLAVFKDIGKAFAKQFDPTTATTHELVRLAAEVAPSTFSPSTFSPSTFSPDAYAPSTFSPSTFSPSVFSPSTFSPSTFSPSTFSPSTFSPSTFSPSTFSPSTFSPAGFTPSIYSATEIAKAFSTAQTNSIVAVAATAGNASESTIVNTWNNIGEFYVRVTGRNGAFNTTQSFTLAITKGPTTCVGVTDTSLTPRALRAATGLQSVILTDTSRVALDELLLLPGGGTLRARLLSLANRAEIGGVIVDVATDARVTALKQQAAANPACPFAKNLVAEEIKGIIDSYRANALRYVVIVGSDDAIPFFRTPDESRLGQESSYVPPVTSNSPSEASLRRDFVLSQDAYGARTRLATSNDLAVPGLAVGRLVETPTEMAGIIDAYVAANGVIVPASSLVTGYDFLEDAANAVRSELAVGTARVVDTLITPNGKSPQDPASWNATQLRQKLLGSRHDVIFLAGHFSANSALAADFATSVLTTDVAASTVDLTNALVFSAGCHAGYNIVDADAIAGVTLPLDWAQAFARKRATLIAGTGYQYGDTDFLEYSERLYRNFARSLRAGTGPVPIGEALVQAKRDYLAATVDVRGIHEKALLEATLFGLPMLAVNMPAGRGAPPGTGPVIAPTAVASGPAAQLGLKTHNLTVAPALTPRTQSLRNLVSGTNVVASWLSGPDGVVSKAGEPALPLATVNVTPIDASVVLRGVGFRGGTYVDSAPLLPFTGAPTTEVRGVHVPFVAPVFYPGQLFTPNYFGALAGTGGTQLLVTPAQHRVASLAAGTSTQRRFTALDLRLFYSGNLTKAALSEAPVIVGVEEERIGSDVVFTANVVGDPGAAIHQVWVTYTSDAVTTWTSLDLLQCVAPLPAVCGTTTDSRTWKGRLVNAPAGLKYLVQAVSGIGLVALDDNRGAYYGVGVAAPSATALELVSPPASAVIGDPAVVNVRLLSGGAPVANRLVLIALGGVAQLGSTATDGTVSVKLPVGAIPGTYLISAAFDGDDTLLASSTTAAFVVTKAPSALLGLSPTGATLTGTMAGKTQALQQEAVAFAVSGPNGATTIFANTNNLGRATLPPPGLPAGTYTVTGASFSGNATFAASSVTFAPAQQFVVAKTPQLTAFGTLPDIAYTSLVELYALATSGLPVSFSASGVCTAVDNIVQIEGIGTCTVTATQAGDGVYAAAAPQVRSFNVGPAGQALVFGAVVPGLSSTGQLVMRVSAANQTTNSPPSTIPITFASLTPAVCTIAGSNDLMADVIFSGPGTCTIAANQAGNTLYNAAAQATTTFSAPTGSPQTFTVTNLNDSGAGSLRAAIQAANSAPGPDQVTFQAGLTGTIVLTSGNIVISGPLTIIGPGAANLTVDGNGLNRIFAIGVTFPACPAVDGPDYLVYMFGLRLTNGRRNVAGSCGGAIYTEHSLHLNAMTIDNSIARCGGGLHFAVQYPGQSLVLESSRFLNNTATELLTPLNDFSAAGGGAYVVEKCQSALDTPYTKPVSVAIFNSEFRGNAVQPLTGRDGRGGGFRSYSRADIVMTDTIVVDNHVDAPNPLQPPYVYRGGGIEGTANSWRIERSEISDNTVNGVVVDETIRSGGLHVYNTAVDLQAPGDRSIMKIINSTISGNASPATAGAMNMSGNLSVELINTTVTGNVAAATRAGGIRIARDATYPPLGDFTARPSLRLFTSIVSGNSSVNVGIGGSLPNFVIQAGNSLVGTVTSIASVFGPSLIRSDAPGLGPLNANGGPTRTHALLPGSPALNTGSNPLGLTTDQRGAGFPRVNGGQADIGAYESP